MRAWQVLLNLSLRIREAFASETEERFAKVLAEVAGPLRVSAQTMVELQGRTTSSPKEALSMVAGDLSPGSGLLAQLSAVREAAELPPAAGPKALLDALTLLESMRAEAERLR